MSVDIKVDANNGLLASTFPLTLMDEFLVVIIYLPLINLHTYDMQCQLGKNIICDISCRLDWQVT
jgi:hypothetical protein